MRWFLLAWFLSLGLVAYAGPVRTWSVEVQTDERSAAVNGYRLNSRGEVFTLSTETYGTAAVNTQLRVTPEALAALKAAITHPALDKVKLNDQTGNTRHLRIMVNARYRSFHWPIRPDYALPAPVAAVMVAINGALQSVGIQTGNVTPLAEYRNNL